MMLKFLSVQNDLLQHPFKADRIPAAMGHMPKFTLSTIIRIYVRGKRVGRISVHAFDAEESIRTFRFITIMGNKIVTGMLM